jgi:iron(III) transport system ATP-binding protein
MTALSVEHVRRVYAGKAAVDGASLELKVGRITCLLGPSGCGKSTLLRLIAGLEPLDGGVVRSPARVLSGHGAFVAPEERDIGFVFQDYALFPHLTVEENVAFGLRRRPARERRATALAQLGRVRLADRAGAYPQALSGGEQQRVALARALAREPAAVLLDEPFSGLDGRLKAEVRDAALEALRASNAAVLIVTHDAEEAMMMADDLALMTAGRILQVGTPRDCYLHPVSVAAARLLGEANELPASIRDGRAETPFGAAPTGVASAGATIMVRPEGVLLTGNGAPARVLAARFAGASALLTLEAGEMTALCRTPSATAPEIGAHVHVALDPRFCAVYPND